MYNFAMGQDFYVQFCQFILTNKIFSFETSYFSVLTVTIGLTFLLAIENRNCTIVITKIITEDDCSDLFRVSPISK